MPGKKLQPAGLNEIERRFADRLSKMLITYTKDTLDWYWELGTLVSELYRTASGDESIERVAKAVGLSSDRMLVDAMRVVERWETRERYDELVRACTSGDGSRMLTFSHIKELSRVNDTDKAIFAQASRAVKENLSVDELRHRLTAELGDKKRKPRGRPGAAINVPTDIAAFIASVKRELGRLRNLLSNAWAGPKNDMLSKLSELAADIAKDEQIVDSLTELLDLVATVSDALAAFYEQFRNIIENEILTTLYDTDDETDDEAVTDADDDDE